MQPHSSHQSVDDERHPGEIPDVLEQRDEEEEHPDLRHEDHDVADAGDDPVDHQVAQDAGRQRGGHAALQPPGRGFDPGDQRRGPGEQRLEEDGHHHRERHKPVDTLRQDAVDPAGPLARVFAGHRPDVGHHRLDPAIPRGDDFVVETALCRDGVLLDRVHRLLDRGWEPGGRAVIGFERQQRPERPGPARRRGLPEAGIPQRLGDRGDLALDLCGQTGPGGVGARRKGERRADRAPELIESDAFRGDGRHHRGAEPHAQPRRVEVGAAGARLVNHVERHDDRDTGLGDLQHEVEPPLERAGVNHDDDRVRRIAAPAEHLVDRDLLVRRVRAEAVGARQIDDLDP